MRYEIMHRLQVIDGENTFRIGARKREIVLASLLVRANRVVSVPALMAEVWGATPPASATAALYNHVSHLRKLLRGSGQRDSPIVRSPLGYSIQIEHGDRDVDVFTSRLARGREDAAEGAHAAAAASLEAAFAQVRSPVTCLVDHGEILTGFTVWLNEARLECFELLMESSLEIGNHREATGRLHRMLVEQPLRETLYQLLMRALYKSDRRADALQVYHTARARLRAELGIEPCLGLQELYQMMLSADRPHLRSGFSAA